MNRIAQEGNDVGRTNETRRVWLFREWFDFLRLMNRGGDLVPHKPYLILLRFGTVRIDRVESTERVVVGLSRGGRDDRRLHR